jgi:hypothetical protein
MLLFCFSGKNNIAMVFPVRIERPRGGKVILLGLRGKVIGVCHGSLAVICRMICEGDLVEV